MSRAAGDLVFVHGRPWRIHSIGLGDLAMITRILDGKETLDYLWARLGDCYDRAEDCPVIVAPPPEAKPKKGQHR